MPTLKVALNGTEENPFHRWSLTQNPFPQIAKAELMGAMNALNKLGGPPVPNVQYIREVLGKHFTPEFVEFVASKFKKGEYVRFSVSFPGEDS